MNRTVSVCSLITGVCFSLGLAGLFLAGFGIIPLRVASPGVALCFVGNLFYFRMSLQKMDAREVQAFELGRDSVRGIR